MQHQGEKTDFRVIAELQEQIIEQGRAIYSAIIIEEALYPNNLWHMAEPDTVQGWCGDTMEIYLQLSDDGIEQVSFMTDGCGPTVACGSMLTTMVHRMSLEEVGAVGPEDLLNALDGLPEESVHCAELAVNVLRKAISNRLQLKGSDGG